MYTYYFIGNELESFIDVIDTSTNTVQLYTAFTYQIFLKKP